MMRGPDCAWCVGGTRNASTNVKRETGRGEKEFGRRNGVYFSEVVEGKWSNTFAC